MGDSVLNLWDERGKEARLSILPNSCSCNHLALNMTHSLILKANISLQFEAWNLLCSFIP